MGLGCRDELESVSRVDLLENMAADAFAEIEGAAFDALPDDETDRVLKAINFGVRFACLALVGVTKTFEEEREKEYQSLLAQMRQG